MRFPLLGLFVGCCLAAHADTLNFDFRNVTGATPSTAAGSSYGNSITFTTGGVSATITAWALTGSNDTLFETAYLGRYSTGLGACNREEVCADPAHQVDNAGQREFVLIQFSKPFDPTTITIDPYGTYDRDVTYYTGTAASGLNLTGKNLTNLASLGFGAAINDDSTASNNARTVILTSGNVNSLLFGARVGSGADSNEDRFKIASMTGVNVVSAPEPATMGVVGAAALLGYLRLRRKITAA